VVEAKKPSLFSGFWSSEMMDQTRAWMKAQAEKIKRAWWEEGTKARVWIRDQRDLVESSDSA
jgi:hypothetical protein